MGQISSGVGLISGINTAQLIEQLLAIDARPKQIIQQHVAVLNSQSTALQEINAKVLALRGALNTLTLRSTFNNTTASTSDPDVMTATGSASAVPGTYSFTPVRLVSTQQSISRGFTDATSSGVGGATLRFEAAAARLDQDTALAQLNGGAGVARGRIRVTDRAGNSALVDLSRAVSVDDVLEAINTASGINVQAAVSGDRLTLTDLSGGAGTLRVENVGATSTAASLGLAADTNPATLDVIEGAQINRLARSTLVTALNDGNGVYSDGAGDLTFTAGVASHNVSLSGARTLGDVIDAINNGTGGLVTAGIDANGTGLLIAYAGSDPLTIAGDSAADLGLATSGATGDVHGSRLIAAIHSKLLKNLRGGAGITAGTIDITTRAATSFQVDLSAASSVSDVVDAINAAGDSHGIAARLNDAGTGLLLTDASGGSGRLVISGAAADDLGIAVDALTSSVNSGSLRFQYVTEATRLSSLNGGRGAAAGKMVLTDSRGISATVDLTGSSITTVGDVIDAINSRGLQITARVNDTGNGILLEDNGPGSVAIKVAESGSTTARDLNLLGTAPSAGADIDGAYEKAIRTAKVDAITGATTLASLNSGAGVRILGSGQPDFRITARDGATYDVTLSGLTKLSEVLDAISAASGGVVTAAINADGTGLDLTDTSTSNGTLLGVTALNGSNAAADLGLLSSDADDDGVLRGSAAVATTTLQELADRINAAGIFVQATLINDGSGIDPFRLSLSALKAGKSGAFVVDSGRLDLGINELVEARDAVVFFGSADPATAIPISSSTNTLTNVVNGVTLDLKASSASPVQLVVSRDDAAVVAAVKAMVDGFNSVVTSLDKYDTYNAETNERGLLLGDPTVARVRSVLYRQVAYTNTDLTGRYNSLGQIGVQVGTGGKLTLDEGTLRTALQTDREATVQLFTYKQLETADDGAVTTKAAGIGYAFHQAMTRLTDPVTGTFKLRTDAISDQVDNGTKRISDMDVLLEAKRQRLQVQFNAMEQALAALQSQSSALSSLSALAAQAQA